MKDKYFRHSHIFTDAELYAVEMALDLIQKFKK